MITVTVQNKNQVKKAQLIMAHEVMYNQNLNGAEFAIEVGDFNQVDGIDEITGTQLFTKIFRSEENY